MAVKVRRKKGKWYIFIDWMGKRKARCVGVSREAAEHARREIERRLMTGDFNLNDECSVPSFSDYAHNWLTSHAQPNLKLSTAEGYEVILRKHLIPAFGNVRLSALTRTRVKSYLADLTKTGDISRNTVRNILATLRSLLSHAVEDSVIDQNPAIRLGRFNTANGRERRVDCLTREEAARFLDATRTHRPERYPFFLTALRSGLRLGELLALEWDDIQFGTSEIGQSRYIIVRHNFVRGHATTPKNRKLRRVDLSRELRSVLMELRDRRTLETIEKSKFDEQKRPAISKLVFPSRTGTHLSGSNVYHRDFLPSLQSAGLRRVTFHALRHTFASLLIQKGASLAYVKEQMGHSSIQVTVDTYGHLIPGGNIDWIDSLDTETSPQTSATPAQPLLSTQSPHYPQVIEKSGRRGGTRTPDPRIRNPMLYPPELHALNHLRTTAILL